MTLDNIFFVIKVVSIHWVFNQEQSSMAMLSKMSSVIMFICGVFILMKVHQNIIVSNNIVYNTGWAVLYFNIMVLIILSLIMYLHVHH